MARLGRAYAAHPLILYGSVPAATTTGIFRIPRLDGISHAGTGEFNPGLELRSDNFIPVFVVQPIPREGVSL